MSINDPHLIAVGLKGQLNDLGVNTLQAYMEEDAKIKASGKEGLLTPLVEYDPRQVPFSFSAGFPLDITQAVQRQYQELCSGNSKVFYPGPFGDFFQVFKTGGAYYHCIIGHKAYRKPGLAARLAVIVKTPMVNGTSDDYYLLTGIRKNPPGVGQPTFFGGFRNVDMNDEGIFVFDSGAYTLLHEAIEEAGLKIEHDNPSYLQTAYTIPAVLVDVTLGSQKYKSIMRYLTTIATSDNNIQEGGETLPNGEKRVYATEGYMVVVDLEKSVEEGYLQSVLRAGDDIRGISIFNITQEVLANDYTQLPNRICFGIKHENYFLPLIVNRLHEDMTKNKK